MDDELLTREEVTARITEQEGQLDELTDVLELTDDAEVDAVTDELEALYWLRDIYWLEAEGFLEIGTGDRLYAVEAGCPIP